MGTVVKLVEKNKLDYKECHKVILSLVEDGKTTFNELLNGLTHINAGELASILGGLFAMKALYSPRPSYFKITYKGTQYLKELITGDG